MTGLYIIFTLLVGVAGYMVGFIRACHQDRCTGGWTMAEYNRVTEELIDALAPPLEYEQYNDPETGVIYDNLVTK